MAAVAVRSPSITVPRWIVPLHDDEEEPRRTFGGVLESERLAHGWSQERVAEAIGVRQGKISDYEADKVKDPPVLNVLALEDLFGLERGDLGVLLWGEKVRQEMRRRFAPSNVFAIRDDAPPVLQELIVDIGSLELEERDLQAVRDFVRQQWQARRARQSRKPTPLRPE